MTGWQTQSRNNTGNTQSEPRKIFRSVLSVVFTPQLSDLDSPGAVTGDLSDPQPPLVESRHLSVDTELHIAGIAPTGGLDVEMLVGVDTTEGGDPQGIDGAQDREALLGTFSSHRTEQLGVHKVHPDLTDSTVEDEVELAQTRGRVVVRVAGVDEVRCDT